MKRLILSLVLIVGLLGCVHQPQTRLTSVNLNGKNKLFQLERLKEATVALLPLRSVLGNRVSNKTVNDQFRTRITDKLPDTKFVEGGHIGKLLRNDKNARRKYAKLLDKYFTRGRFSKADLSIFQAANVDYVIAISLNGGSQNPDYPKNYLFLISMQIWEVNTGEMVWDATLEGGALVESRQEFQPIRKKLMKNLCNAVLAKLS